VAISGLHIIQNAKPNPATPIARTAPMIVDPIKYTAPENHMVFPMNFRPLVSFWNLLFLHGDPLEPLPNRSAQWNRGRYLVEGAGHCSSCHSPLNLIGGEKGSELFNGGVVDGWTAPALRGMTEAQHPWNEAQLVAYLTGEVAEGHGAAAGPMLPVSLSIAQLPAEDAHAIAQYILDLKKTSSDAPSPPLHLWGQAQRHGAAGRRVVRGGLRELPWQRGADARH